MGVVGVVGVVRHHLDSNTQMGRMVGAMAQGIVIKMINALVAWVMLVLVSPPCLCPLPVGWVVVHEPPSRDHAASDVCPAPPHTPRVDISIHQPRASLALHSRVVEIVVLVHVVEIVVLAHGSIPRPVLPHRHSVVVHL